MVMLIMLKAGEMEFNWRVETRKVYHLVSSDCCFFLVIVILSDYLEVGRCCL